MTAPVNLILEYPNIPGWDAEARNWRQLNADVGGNEDFGPLTIKAVYVIGVIYAICESVSHLLDHSKAKETTYIPAYGVFASGIELLGRCVNGNSGIQGCVEDLKTGFKWLAAKELDYKNVQDSSPIADNLPSYTIEMLTALRHFAAHGQAASGNTAAVTNAFGNIHDYEILSHMPPLIAAGLEKYWKQLQEDKDLCNQLAKANIIALRSRPVFESWKLFERDKSGKYPSVQEIFDKFKWNSISKT